jgi:DNA replication protein DnaC
MDLSPEQEQLLREAAADNERKRAEIEAAKAKRDRTAMMDDVIRQYRRSGGFKGDAKVRWRLCDDPATAVEKAADLLMRGLAYAIGPSAQWLPEYDQVAEWLSDNQGKGLMCIGDCGRGKTVITRDILSVLFAKTIRVRFQDGTTGHPVYNYFLAKELKSRWAEVERCKIICVDDVGTEAIAKVYGETHNYFAELVDLCNDRDKLLICSTNLSQEQLFGGVVDEPDDPARPDGPTHRVVYPQRYDQRILSRLTGNTVRVWFEGEDLRMKR